MRLPSLLFVGAVVASLVPFARAADVVLPAKEKLQIYLLMGQSNMAGRGKSAPGDEQKDERVLVFGRENKWEVATDPLHWDKPKVVGVGPGLSFGIAMAKTQSAATIGLVPCAVGGTPLSRWVKGGDLYTAALERAKAAAAQGTLAGAIWHQGESDSSAALSATYLERFTRMVEDLRADLGIPNLPFVAGELGEFHVTKTGATAGAVNAALHQAEGKLKNYAVVSSAGLVDGGDKLHFDAASQREFGRRYAEAMQKLITSQPGAK